MIGYNPSHLNKNETLLEAFHRVEAYLKANPLYQVYQSSAQYQENTQFYTLNTIIVPEGSTVSAGDVVFFSNAYYAVITEVSELTFYVEYATNFRGTDGTKGKDGKDGVTPNIAVSATVDNSEGTPSVEVTKSGTNENPSFAFDFHNIKGEIGTPGPQGPKGETGAIPNITMTALVDGGTGEPSVDVFKGNTLEQPHYTFNFHNLKGEPGAPGPTGENGKNGSNGKNGNATYLCSNQITQNTAAISKNGITILPGRSIQLNDILISTAITTFGAMAQVTDFNESVVTVNFIGTLKSDGSGVSDYNQLDNIPVINQDLIVSGFTPVANTYYRHTGATNNTFTQGVIYFYDTAYHKLGESGGGGTTFNKYALNVSYQNRDRIRRVYQQAKGRVYIDDLLGENSNTPEWMIASIESAVLSIYTTSFDNNSHTYYKVLIRSFPSDGKQYYKNFTIEKNVNPSISAGESSGQFNLVYYNDTEII